MNVVAPLLLRGSLPSDPNTTAMLASTSSSRSFSTTSSSSSSSSSFVLSGRRKRSLSLKRCARVKPRATRREGDEEDATISTTTTTTTTAAPNNTNTNNFDRDLNKFVKKTATTFAPSSSGEAKKKKNPATKGTALYAVFEVQAYLAIVVGGLLAFNVIYPSEEPTIARLMGMWSVWMFTVPSLRARDCGAKEKDALNLLFIAIPLVNVLIPFVWKSFAGVFTADVLLMLGVYYSKNAPPFGEEDATAAEPSE